MPLGYECTTADSRSGGCDARSDRIPRIEDGHPLADLQGHVVADLGEGDRAALHLPQATQGPQWVSLRIEADHLLRLQSVPRERSAQFTWPDKHRRVVE